MHTQPQKNSFQTKSILFAITLFLFTGCMNGNPNTNLLATGVVKDCIKDDVSGEFITLIENKEYDGILAYCERILQENPRNVSALLMQAEIYDLIKNNKAEAKRILLKALEIDSNNQNIIRKLNELEEMEG